jgi:hypothetical protein
MSRYRQTMSELLKQVRGIKEQDDQDHEISMARGELEAIADKATQLASMLKDKSDDGNPLEAWVQSKITKAKDYINSVSDYLMYNPDMKQNEETELEEVEKEETILEKSFTSQQIKQAYGILNDPSYKGGNYDGAVKAIEKIAKGLSNHPDVANALKRANEEVDLDEGRIKDIYTMQQDGKSSEEIAKYLKLPVKTVKSILGEEMGEVSEENLDEFTSDMIKRLKKSYSTMPQKLSTDQANALSRHLDRLDLTSLKQLAKEKIPFLTTLARNKIYKKTGKFESLEEQDGVEIAKIRADRDKEDKKEVASKEKEIENLKNQNTILKQKLENEKNKAIKPEPNPETGEVPLTIGIANKLLKDKAEKEAKKKEEMKEEKRLYVESIAAVKNKAEKTGMPYSILKQVYDRGMAAWKGGHRPGVGQVQWALARVNSFVTKSSGTWGGADKDLAAKVKGSK